ncbi:GroES-like protein [Thozetella sp. PMI_491]|nr:GroES-like protein [Thozetella sp. PMI_491]
MAATARFDYSDGKLHLNEIAIPAPKAHQILVKVACASLCQTDAMLFKPNDQGLILSQKPTTIGHEGTGYVVELGADVANFTPGDAVGMLPANDCCYQCYACRNVNNVWCASGNQKVHGLSADGFFQEYVVVDAKSVLILPPAIDPSESAPLFCAGLTAFHSVEEAGLQPGQWVAIIGCGGLGYLGVQYAKAMGLKVVAVDISEPALEDAKLVGADHVLNPSMDESYVDKIKNITNGGADAVINFTASKESYDDAPAMVRLASGLIMVVGIPQKPLQFNALDIAMGKYRIKGGNNGHTYNMHRAIDFSAKHNIKPRLTIYKLEQVPEMMDLMRTGKARGRLGVRFE